MTVQEAKALIMQVPLYRYECELEKGRQSDLFQALNMCVQALEEVEQYRALGTVEELKENKDFLEFLYNAIQPNEMEQYLSMYKAKDTKATATEGYADQCGLMSAT